MNSTIHPSAFVEENVRIGNDCHIWHYCQVRANVTLEDHVSLGKGVYIDKDITVARGTRIQNGVNVYKGVEIAPWCFIGPMVVFTNDVSPRAGNRVWELSRTILNTGVSIGAGAIVISGIELGAFCLIGAGSIVTKSIPPFHIAYGAPAVPVARTCACGRSRFPLEERTAPRLADCCRSNLIDEAFENARQYIEKSPC